MSEKFSTVWDFGDYLAANRISAKMRRGRQWLLAIFAITVGVFLSDPFNSDLAPFGILLMFGLPILVGILAGLLGFWIVDKLILPRKSRNVYDQLRLDKIVTNFDFDESGIRISSSLGTSNLDWGHFTKWTEDGRLLIIYRTAHLFYLIPKSQVAPEAVDSLRKALIAANVSKA